MQAPKIPSEWNECSWEQIQEIYKLMGEHTESRSIRNLHIWLYLANLTFADGEGEIADDGEVTYYLRTKTIAKTKTDKNEEFFAVKADDLSLYLNGSHLENFTADSNSNADITDKLKRKVEMPGALDWVDEMVGKKGQGGLTKLPIDTISIGGKQWRLPSELITNITYEQYTNAQQLQQAVWGLTDNIRQQFKTLSPAIPLYGEGAQTLPIEANGVFRAASESGCGPTEGSESPLATEEEMSQSDREGLESLITDLQHYRAQLLSHLLIPAEKGAEYKSEDAEERIDFFAKHIDDIPYLLDILIQHMQSCLGVYKTQFQDLFSGDGNGADTIPMVSEVNTINAIMKWQGYQEQQKVFDSNAIFIFSILNSMTKEAKAIEEANAKMKSHRK